MDRILHFSVKENPKEDDYILISIDRNTTCEDILKDNKIKEIIIKKLETINGFHFPIINPEKICIGGSFSYFEDVLYKKLVERAKKYTYQYEMPEIVLAELKNDAGIIA